jgi:hypothetical protein
LVPFVTGGVGFATAGEGSVALMNFGGGLTYWFRDGIGLRVGVRDTFDAYGIHQVALRLGVTF